MTDPLGISDTGTGEKEKVVSILPPSVLLQFPDSGGSGSQGMDVGTRDRVVLTGVFSVLSSPSEDSLTAWPRTASPGSMSSSPR